VSWKTSALGFIAIAAAILGVLSKVLSGQPVNLEVVIPEIVAAIGLLAARDNDKTSEDVGAKKE
jgi:hypothetical protein